MTPTRLLLVEDEAIIAADLRRHLERLGFQVLETTGAGEDALPLAERLQPDLILMDIGLAGEMDGIATAAAIHARQDIPIVFLTAHADPATLQRAKAAQPVGYLAKPFQISSLAATLEMALHQHQLTLQLKESQARLARESQRYQLLLQTSTDAIHILDRAGNLRECNPAFLAHLGCSAEQAAGLNVADWDAQWPAEALRVKIRELIQTPGRFETRHRRRDGQVRRVEINASGVVLEGEEFVYASARDITERKRAEEQLEQRNRELQALQATLLDIGSPQTLPDLLKIIVERACGLLGTASGGLYLCDPVRREARCVVSHRTAKDYTGASLKYGEGAAGRVAESGQALLIDDYRTWSGQASVFSADQPFVSVLSVPMKWNQAVIGVLHALRDAPGGVFNADDLALLTRFADHAALAVTQAGLRAALEVELTERRQAEQAARESEARFQVLADSAPVLIWMSGLDKLGYLFNKTWLEFTGRTLEQEMGHGWVEGVHPDDRERCLQIYAQAFDARREFEMEYRLRRHDGVYRWIVDRGVPRWLAEGEFAGYIGSCIDITERRQMEEALVREHGRLRALSESSRDGALLIGLDGAIYVINQQALDLLNLASQPAAWVGRHFRRLLAELPAAELAPLIRAERARLRTGDQAPSDGEWEYADRWLHWFNLPVRSDERLLGRLIVLRDVTPERQVEKLRDDLTRTMVHDLRNPLTALRGALDVFALDGLEALSADQHEMLKMMDDESQRMLGMVSSILDISRLESGSMPLERSLVWLPALVGDTLRLEAPLAAQRQINLSQSLLEDLPPVQADLLLLQRVAQNLIGNALKFTPAGGTVRVTAALETHTPGNDPWVRVSVSDSGPGIAPDLQPRLFHKFVTGNLAGRGSGLGLAFCRLAVEAHGGRIWVESTPGQGAAFHFTLPA